jgi:hypothetical protein
MRSVMLEHFEACVCNPLNLLREPMIVGPEVGRREVIQISVVLPDL